MNVKQQEGAFKNKPDLIIEQTKHDVFDEFQPNTPGPEESVEIKEEIIDYEEPNIEQNSEKNVEFCSTNKKELENTSEVKDRDVKDLKKDNSEYIQSEFELLTTHCDLPTLKNDNSECSDGLTEEQVDGLKNNTSAVLNKKRKQYTRRTNFNGHFLRRRVDFEFNGKLLKKKVQNKNLINHTNKKPFKCELCYKGFSLKSGLQTHLRIHTNEKPFHCNICSKEFSQKSNLKTHLKTHIDEKLFKCDICFKKFNHKQHLQIHFRTHTNEKPFNCKICSKEFAQKSNLQTHLKTHTNEKPFKCNICSKEFGLKFNLHTHLKIHTNEKPFQCKICFKKFIRKSHLEIHLKTHTNEKPFQCNICPKEFTQKCHLQTHLKTHTNENAL